MLQQRLTWILIILTLIGGGYWVWQSLNEEESSDFSTRLISADAIDLPNTGFQAVNDDYNWQFPADYAPHPQFQREEWRFSTDEGCAVRLSLVFSRVSIIPEALLPDTDSLWRSHATYIADLRIEGGGGFAIEENRAQRAALSLAGSEADRIWIDRWELNFSEGTFNFSNVTSSITGNFNLEAASEPSTSDGWHYYRRAGQINGEIARDERLSFDCGLRLEHRFGSADDS